MESLWDLAHKKQQPDWQYLDKETLDEIEKNRPVLESSSVKIIFSPEDLKLIKCLIPHYNWYLEKRIILSIHGVSHALRVMIFTLLLSKLYNLSKKETISLLLAAAVHDVRRLNDKGDEEHGNRVVLWLKSTPFEIFIIDPQVLNGAIKILRGNGPFSKLLKTADALDRYRLPKTKWWLNESFLEVIPSEDLKNFAFELIIKSERKILDGKDPVDAVLNTII